MTREPESEDAPKSIDGAPVSGQQLHRMVRRGMRAVVAAQIGSQLVSLVVLAGLYRAVRPSEFGLLGMVLPVLLLVRLFTVNGLSIAVVQRSEVSHVELSAAFWLNLTVGLIGSAVTAVLAPVVSWFYDEPRLVVLTLALAGTSLVSAAGAVHQALLERKLWLGPLSVRRLAAQFCGGMAGIVTALFGWGVWALVVQQYVELGLLAALAWRLARWQPSWPLAALRRGASLGPWVRFGGFYNASSLMFYLTTNVDKVLIGRLAGETVLGYYSQAFNFMMRPVTIVTTPLCAVMLPTLARSAREPALYHQWILSFFRLLAIVLLPVGVGLFFVGEDVMPILGGPQWIEAGPLLSILALSIVGQGFINIANRVFASAGRSDFLFYGSVVVALVMTISFFVGWHFAPHNEWPAALRGAEGVAWAYSLTLLVVVLVPYLLACCWTAWLDPRALGLVLARPVLYAVGMGMCVWLCRLLVGYGGLPTVGRLVAEVCVGVISYVLLAREEIHWLLRQPWVNA